ncbi:DNA-3-methyladenine glycosylase [Pseudotabrizicola algicola]|uniref:Putative 3-methyladenine DNA glycosylase n=1 Tax=Pseudotabrizicola algicola TaxID=2709381 RepID=A0A6B3RR93_9RHOB|nr:DNA-3-methyladenine glycosylase [Pseudotabrizicola algicola]NEX46495.1 DNA-3-methyladenine glycosylase [Pseudotabrizicola algicola]
MCSAPVLPAPDYFDREIGDLARSLIGATLLVRGVGGTVVETEAYGRDDPASHSFIGLTPRNAAMFGPPGSVYIYLSYGCHLCLNVVGRAGEAVLFRAILPEVGRAFMAERRGATSALASGPGRLGQALGVSLADNGQMFGAGDYSLLSAPSAPRDILVGPRIGLSKATDRLWRFGLAGASGLSRPFPPQQ